MKKFYVALLFSVISIVAFCQQRDITRFLNIPIDGDKSEMMNRIKAKGFKTTKFEDGKVLTGRFNGEDVYIDVLTNDKNEVYRVVVWDKTPCDERQIRIRYNNLCYQFKENSKYLSNDDWSIPEEDDISYELNIRKKNYQAVYFQWPTEIGDSIIQEQVLEVSIPNKLQGKYDGLSEEEYHSEFERLYLEKLIELSSKKRVWFTIMEQSIDRYAIVMYYENVYNMANGEDL